jgi:hypothetical protein
MVNRTLMFICLFVFVLVVPAARIKEEHELNVLDQSDAVLVCDSTADSLYRQGLDLNKLGSTREAMNAFDEALGLCPSPVYMGSAANMRLKLVQQWQDVQPESVTRENLSSFMQEALELYAQALAAKQLSDKQRAALEPKQSQAQQLAELLKLTSEADVDAETEADARAWAEAAAETEAESDAETEASASTEKSSPSASDRRVRCPAALLNAPLGQAPFVTKNVGKTKYRVRAGERNRGGEVAVTCNKNWVKIENVDVTCSGRKALCKDSVSAGIKACTNEDTNPLAAVVLDFRARPYIAGCKCYVDAMAGFGLTQLAVQGASTIDAPMGLRDWCTEALSDSSPNRMKYFGQIWTFTSR